MACAITSGGTPITTEPTSPSLTNQNFMVFADSNGNCTSGFVPSWGATPAAVSLTNALPIQPGTGSIFEVSPTTSANTASNPFYLTGNVGGKTAQICVTPTVTTSNAYGVNYVVGGLLTFANAFTSTGSGVLESVAVTIKDVETGGFTFVPFNSGPTNTTWTNAAVAAINAADIPSVREPVGLLQYNGLGTMTVAYADGLGEALNPGSTTLYGVLIANAALSNNFSGTGDVQVCVKVLDDI